MKKQTTIQRALTLRKISSARRKQRGFAMEWIIIVLLIAVALVPLILWLSHIMQEKVDEGGGVLIAPGQSEISAEADKHQEKMQGLQKERQQAGTSSTKLSGDGSGANFENNGDN